MQEKNLNAQGGLTLLCLAPQNAIQPEKVIRPHRSKSRSGKGGLTRSPPSSNLCFLFHLQIKEFYEAQNSVLKMYFLILLIFE